MDSRTAHLGLVYRPLPATDVEKAYTIEIAEYPESEAASLENLVYRQANAPQLFLGCYARSQPQSQAEPRLTTSFASGPGNGPDQGQGEQESRVRHEHKREHDVHGDAQQGLEQQPAGGGSDEVLVGYVVSTLSPDKSLTHSSMSTHDPQGTSVCIHSVCVAKPYQRRGIATAMVKEYLKHLTRLNEQSSSEKADPPTLLPSPSSLSAGYRQERVLLIAHYELIDLYKKAGFNLVGQSIVEHGPDPWYEMVYQL
ncbi:hypothetical protein B0O80DRAFT_493269 [Mortierella sp. GBAus27b]|nr:hypothetical protein B0O80DRAFT_493269 [Mortierella sp. GBAus27b]